MFISGDGLMHEIINGLFVRRDFEEIRDKITIGGIPGGSGNGLMKSVLTQAGEDFGVKEAAYLVIRGQKTGIDITKLTLETRPEKPVYSSLSVSWSSIADMDLNSENMRWIGELRFELRAAWRVLSLMSPRATLKMRGTEILNRN